MTVIHKKTEIIKQIDELRVTLHELMEKSDDLKDNEILIASKALDVVLNEYYFLIRKKDLDCCE